MSSLNLSQNMVFEKMIELLIEQFMELNKKIDLLETKINKIIINKDNILDIKSKIKQNDINNIDWYSIHLY
jgi:hypothetical protein